MSLSLKSLKSRSKKLFSNDLLTNLVIFISIALAVSYLTTKKYEALLLLVVIASVIQLIGKNLLYSLVIAIILTNLLISSRVLKFREGMKHDKDKHKDKEPHKKPNIDDINKYHTFEKTNHKHDGIPVHHRHPDRKDEEHPPAKPLSDTPSSDRHRKK